MPCPPGTVLNPYTLRCVSTQGKIAYGLAKQGNIANASIRRNRTRNRTRNRPPAIRQPHQYWDPYMLQYMPIQQQPYQQQQPYRPPYQPYQQEQFAHMKPYLRYFNNQQQQNRNRNRTRRVRFHSPEPQRPVQRERERVRVRARPMAGPRECPPGKELNPYTNRCIKVDGKTYKRLREDRRILQPSFY